MAEKEKGMSEWEIRRRLSKFKTSEEKEKYLNKVWHKGALLAPKTQKSLYKVGSEEFAHQYEEKAQTIVELYVGSGVPKEEVGMKFGKLLARRNDYVSLSQAAAFFRYAGTKEGHASAAKVLERMGYPHLTSAAREYLVGGMFEKAKEVFKKAGDWCMKRAKESEHEVGEGSGYKFEAKFCYDEAAKIGEANNLEKIVTALMLFSGFGLLLSYFSKPQVIGTTFIEQLAPPMPDYLPFVFLFFVITGSFYFLIKHFKKKKEYSIPLGFAK